MNLWVLLIFLYVQVDFDILVLRFVEILDLWVAANYSNDFFNSPIFNA